jgi:ABC-type multidrug transport system fused ATPase/permease subunit
MNEDSLSMAEGDLQPLFAINDWLKMTADSREAGKESPKLDLPPPTPLLVKNKSSMASILSESRGQLKELHKGDSEQIEHLRNICKEKKKNKDQKKQSQNLTLKEVGLLNIDADSSKIPISQKEKKDNHLPSEADARGSTLPPLVLQKSNSSYFAKKRLGEIKHENQQYSHRGESRQVPLTEEDVQETDRHILEPYEKTRLEKSLTPRSHIRSSSNFGHQPTIADAGLKDRHVDEQTTEKFSNPLDHTHKKVSEHSFMPTLAQYMIGNCSVPKLESQKSIQPEGSQFPLHLPLATEASPKPRFGASADGSIKKVVPTVEDSSQKPTAKPKITCFKRVKNFIQDRLSVIFFLPLRRFFGDNYLEESKKLNPIKEEDRMLNVLKDYKKVKSDKEKGSIFLSEGKLPLIWNLILLAKSDIIWACIFRVLKQAINVSIPFIMLDYLTKIRGNKDLEIGYALGICISVGLLTMIKELVGQQAFRYTSFSRKKMINMLRVLFYEKLVTSNYEFLSKVNSGFTSKMVLFDIDPIVEFVCVFPPLAAAPVTTFYGFFMIWSSLNFSVNFWYAFVLYIVTLIMAMAFMRWSVHERKAYRATANTINGYLYDYIKHIKLVKINSLQTLLMNQISTFRKAELAREVKMIFFDTAIDIMFFSPSLATSLVLIFVQRAVTGSFDVVIMFSIISALSQLRKPLLALTEVIERYADFKKSYSNFCVFFEKVPDFPKVSIRRLPYTHDLSGDHRPVVYVCPKNYDEKFLPKSVHDNFSVWLKKCTFIDKTKEMEGKVHQIFFEDSSTDSSIQKISWFEQLVLRSTSLKTEKGAKVCLMGSEYSGIEYFLLALKKEIELVEGEMFINGKTVMFDKKKTHLILDLSFRDNIILDDPFDQEKFDEVCAALSLDFSMYDGKEYGIVSHNLKNITRYDKFLVLLARALYQDFEVFLLFNFFNLLHFEDKLPFFETIVEKYLVNSTVFFYSNDNVLAKRSDLILYFEDGHVVEQGTYTELMLDSNSKVATLLKDRGQVSGYRLLMEELQSGELTRRKRRRNAIAEMSPETLIEIRRKYEETLMDRSVPRLLTFFFAIVLIKRKFGHFRKIKQQNHNLRNVVRSKNIVMRVFRLLAIKNACIYPAIFLLMLLAGFMLLFWDVWLGWWSTNFLKFDPRITYFYILIGISGGIIVFIGLKDVLNGRMLYAVTQVIFKAAQEKLVTAKMKWFEEMNPNTITFRMTVDQATLDIDFPKTLNFTMYNLMMALMGFLVLNFAYPGWFFIITVFVMLYLISIIYRYIRTIRLFMTEWFNRRLIWYNSYVLTLNHLLGLRLISKQRYFDNYFIFVLESFVRIGSHAGTAGNRWLGIRVSLVLGLFSFGAYLCPILHQYLGVWNFKENIWIVGLGLTWVQRVSDFLSEALLNGLQGILNNLEAADRILELKLFEKEEGEEKPLFKVEEIAAANQPHTGKTSIEKRNEYSRKASKYHDRSDPVLQLVNVNYFINQIWVLKKLDLALKAGERKALIQLVGSSIEMLFDIILRFREPTLLPAPANLSTLLLKGKPFSEYDPVDFRRNFLLMSEDPVILVGTLRDNVDPFRLHSEEDIVKVLHFFGFYKALCSSIRTTDPRLVAKYVASLPKRSPTTQRGELRPIQLLKTLFASQKQKIKCCSKKTAIPAKKTEADIHHLVKVRSRLHIVFIAIRAAIRMQTRVQRRLAKKQATELESPSLEDSQLSRRSSSARFSVYAADDWEAQKRLKEVQSARKADKSSKEKAGDLKFEHHHKGKKPKESRLHHYTIKDEGERKAVHELLEMWLASDSTLLNFPLKRILAITRVVLEKPAVLLMEERALIIDYSWPLDHVADFFEAIPNTAVLCSMTSFKLLNYFEEVCVFDHNAVIEAGNTQELQRSETSALNARVQQVDSRKITKRRLSRHPSLVHA